MGLFNQIMGIPDPPKGGGNGNGNVHEHKKPPSKEQKKTDTRRHYEKEVEKMTPEEQERANRRDEPRDGKLW